MRSPPEVSRGMNILGKGTSKCKGPEAGIGPGVIGNSRETQGKGGSGCGQTGSRGQATEKIFALREMWLWAARDVI